jgi:phosphate transport system ATP-binding protein
MTKTKENTVAPVMSIEDISISYGDDKYAVKHVSAKIDDNSITAIMGPSGCGKTTLLRAINRMHELYPNIHTEGKILLSGENVYDMTALDVRRQVGMVFQRPNPFPTLSIYDNVIAGYRLNGIRMKKQERDAIVEKSLRDVALWDEVKDSLHSKGNFLVGRTATATLYRPYDRFPS